MSPGNSQQKRKTQLMLGLEGFSLEPMTVKSKGWVSRIWSSLSAYVTKSSGLFFLIDQVQQYRRGWGTMLTNMVERLKDPGGCSNPDSATCYLQR
jgi:hypothetical protein